MYLILQFIFQVYWILWWNFGCTGLIHFTSTSFLEYMLHIRDALGFVKEMQNAFEFARSVDSAKHPTKTAHDPCQRPTER